MSENFTSEDDVESANQTAAAVEVESFTEYDGDAHPDAETKSAVAIDEDAAQTESEGFNQPVSTDEEYVYGTDSKGQELVAGIEGVKRGNYENTPTGQGAEVGAGWVLEREEMIAEIHDATGARLDNSAYARLEAAVGELEIEERRKGLIPTYDDVHEYYVESNDRFVYDSREDDVYTLWDEVGDDILEASPTTGVGQTLEMSVPEMYEEVREMTVEAFGEWAARTRQSLTDDPIEGTARLTFERYTNNGERTAEAEQATRTSDTHRSVARDFTQERDVFAAHPRWGTSPETETVKIGGQTVEVAVEPVAPVGEAELEAADRYARVQTMTASQLADIESPTMRLFDRHADILGLEADETFFADLSEDLEEGEAHPANEQCDQIHVAPDGSVERTADAFAMGIPSVEHIRTSFEEALAEKHDELAAYEPAMKDIWHATGSQSLADIDADWPGCTAYGRVARSFVPNDPTSQAQVFMLEDIAPSLGGDDQLADEAKVTVWRNSYLETEVAEGDIVMLSNAKPGQYRNQKTLAATGGTTISVLKHGNGPIRTYIDAIDFSGANDGAHRPQTGDTLAVEGTIDDEQDAEVTRIHDKRHRQPEATFIEAPGYEDKLNYVAKPMARKRLDWQWSYPVTEWVARHSPLPEGDLRKNVTAELVPIGTEPTEFGDDDKLDISTDELALALARLENNPGDEQEKPWLGQVPGARSFQHLDSKAEVSMLADPETLEDAGEVIMTVTHHPHAPEGRELRVFSGIDLSGEDVVPTIRIREWDTEADEAVGAPAVIVKTAGWDRRLVKTLRDIRDAEEDEHRLLPEERERWGDDIAAEDIRDLSRVPRGEQDPRTVYLNEQMLWECPVCGETDTDRTQIVTHMGGKAVQGCDEHKAAHERAPDTGEIAEAVSAD